MYKTLILCLISALWSCTTTFDDLDEFERYIRSEDSPYVQTTTKNDVKFSVRYMPAEAMMMNEYRTYEKKRDKVLSDTSLTKGQAVKQLEYAKEKLQKRKDNYRKSVYFHLTVSFEDQAKDVVYHKMQYGFDTYSQWLQKLMFGLNENIYLQTASVDKIPIGTYHMERTFGMSKNRTFILIFPKQYNEQDVLDPNNKWLKFKIKEFGLRRGSLNFTFDLPMDEVKYLFEQ